MFWHRQWEEEEKQRKQVAEPIPDHDAAEADDDDTGSTKGGVLHEEGFSETKIVSGHNGQHDLEQAHSSSQHEQGLLEVLKVVDWWKVCITFSVRITESYICGCFTLSVCYIVPRRCEKHLLWPILWLNKFDTHTIVVTVVIRKKIRKVYTLQRS